MERNNLKYLVAALATAFAGAAFANTDKVTTSASDNSVTTADNTLKAEDSAKGRTSDKATSYDTGKTAPYSGAEGVKSTAPASDEDHNDNGGAPATHHKLKHHSAKARVDTSTDVQSSAATPDVKSSAGSTGGNAAPAGSDAKQQHSTNGQ
jgi:hypothetical protein